MSVTVAAAVASSVNQVIPTSIPASASASAVARPMPDSPPVTIAVRGIEPAGAASGPTTGRLERVTGPSCGVDEAGRDSGTPLKP